MSVRIQVSDEMYRKPTIKIMCLDISDCTQTQQFLICSCAVFVFFLLYGYMQELLFSLEGFKPFGWYLTLVQFAYYTIFGFVERKLLNQGCRRIPMSIYFLYALLTLGTMGFSNASLGYLNYPTQVIFKCCKLVPVLIGSILIQGKRYGPLHFCAAILMCVGLTLFVLADSQVSPNFHTTGVIMISMALLCDAVIGNVQEKAMKAYGASNCEMVFYSYGLGFIYLFVVMVFTGELLDSMQFFAMHPWKTYGYALIFSATGYLGIQIVLTLLRTCGAYAAVTVTTCRKAVTIILSFMFFSKPFTSQYLWSGLLVLLGIYLNIYSKNNPLSMSDLEAKLEFYFLRFYSKMFSRHYASQHLTTQI